MRNRKLICEWCYERGKADKVIELVKENGKTYAVVNDFGKLRDLFGQMLREVQRIKSEGDYEAGKALVAQGVESVAITESDARQAKGALVSDNDDGSSVFFNFKLTLKR